MHMALSKAQNVKTRNDLISLIKERGITHIKVGFFDLDSVMVSKIMSIDKFLSALNSNFSFCAVAFGWDTGYTDAEIEILPFTYRELPLEKKIILVQGQVVGELKSFARSVNNDFYEELLQLCNEMELPIESEQDETGPRQLEVALEVMETSHTADNAAPFKVFSKLLAQRQNRMVSFMAKWHSDYSGQGGHIHVPLKNKDGSRAFYDATKLNKISGSMRWFIGGLQRYASGFMATHAPNINSYRRSIPSCWAPTSVFWGIPC